tara:strand:- start:1866 stop:2060 length:195 start_codon:yes stop_codon:yes gene_type:complete
MKNIKKVCVSNNSCPGAIYGLGFLGSAIYYISIASSFWVGVLGVLKSFVWPAFLVFELLKFVGA